MENHTEEGSFDVVITGNDYEVYGHPDSKGFALHHAPLAIRAYGYRAVDGKYKVNVYRNNYDGMPHYVFSRYV